jgi:phage host-nuclease inhibitor protein Gam
MFDNMTGDEWKRLNTYLYDSADISMLPVRDIQVIRRDLLELSKKVQDWVDTHEDDNDVVDKATELDLNILYLLRDLDWMLEGLL